MNIQKTDEDCFFIEFTEEDMSEYDIRYSPCGTCTAKEENVILHILKENKENVSFKKADISILPGIKGGCIAVVKKKTEEDFPFLVFESENLDNFIDLAVILSERNLNIPSSLYKDEDSYRIITDCKNEDALLLLCEFSENLSFPEREKEYTENYFRCLIEKRALEILCGK